MNCPNCGAQVSQNDRFCTSCGSVLKNENNQVNDQSVTRQDYVANNVNSNIDNGSNQVVNSQNYGNANFNPVGYNQTSYAQGNYNVQSTNYSQNVNDSDSKVCVILSIIIPIVMLIFKWFVGTSLYIDIIVATVGLTLAKKGEASSKPLSITGMVLNIIFIVLAVVFFIFSLLLVASIK